MSRGLGTSYRITPAQRAALEEELVIKTSELLRLLMERGRHSARPPISNFYVGAAGLGCSGTVYLGVNLEFPPLPINGDTVHGEQSAVALAFVEGERDLTSLITFGGHPW